MSTLLQEPTAEEAAQLQFVIEQYLEEMRRLNAEMAADQAEIERIQAESRQIGLQTRAPLANIQNILAKLEAS